MAEIERLPETKNVFELRRHCIDSLAKALTPQGILTTHQVRGAVASYIKSLESDLKSVAASGWGAELIPEEQILQSQFPEVLAQIEKDRTRIAELEGLFAAANETEDEDADLENVDTENGVLPKALVKALKDERKTLAGEVKGIKKLVKERRLDARRTERTGSLFGNSNEILTEANDTEEEGLAKWQRIQEIDEQLARHTALEGELKKLKANIREATVLPISWSSDNGSHLFVHSVDEGSGGSSSIGTYLSQVAENSAGVRYPRELCGRSVLYSPFQRRRTLGPRFALELLAVQEFVANLAME